LSRLLPLYLARVAGEETVGLKNRTVLLCIDFAECSGYREAECFGLAFEASADKVYIHIKHA
jgi:hypothetical protein